MRRDLFCPLCVIILLFTCSAKLSSQTDTICATLSSSSVSHTALQTQLKTVIPVAFHVVRLDDGSGDVTDQQILDQMYHLNYVFNSADFYFYSYSIDRTNNTSWSNQSLTNETVEFAMKNALAVNPTNILNVYVCVMQGTSPLGYARFPWEFAENSYKHGIILRNNVLPGGINTYFNEGDVLVHEIGHYLGLYHTFHNGCNSPGDYVEDTPPQTKETMLCNVTNSCSVQPPPNPNNFMDSGTDACRTTFTNGQIERMHAQTSQYRPSMYGKSYFTVDQVRESGARLTGTSVGKWNGISFVEQTIPFDISIDSEANATLRGKQDIVTSPNEKYYQWNSLSNVKNHRSFDALESFKSTVSKFRSTNNATIKAEAIDGNIIAGFVEFRDPWYIDYPDTAYNNNMRNRGDEAIFQQVTSAQNNLGISTNYKGVFRGLNPNAEIHFYSLRAPLSQSVSGLTWNFLNWSTNGSATLSQVGSNPSGYDQKAVVFTGDNAEVKANYKARLATGDPVGYKNSGQRKVIRTPDGYIHMVYASAGKIWYEIGVEESGGITWVLANNGQPISSSDAKSPSLSNYGNTILIVFQERTGSNNYKIIFQPYYLQSSLSRSEITTDLSSYNDDANPVVACNDDGRVVIVWKQSSGTQGIYYKCATLSGGSQIGAPTISGILPGTDANSNSPSIASNRFIHNTVYWYFPLVYSHNNNIYFYHFYYKNGVGWLTENALNISSGLGYTQNYEPSIITWGSDGARVAWIGKRWEEGGGMDKRKAEEQGAWVTKTLFKNPAESGTFFTFEQSVNSVQVQKNIASNGTEVGYLIGWSALYGTNNRYVKHTSFYPTKSFGIYGEDVQIIGGTSFENTYGTFLNYSNPLYKIERSSSIQTLGKEDLQYAFSGREGIVAVNDAEVFFTLGDIQVDGETIKFKEKHDTLDIDSEPVLNEYLTTDPFILSDGSHFQYSIQYGFTDSSALASALTENGSISFKVELIDHSTGQVIGSFDEITYTPANLYQYSKTGYIVNTEGIGTKTVRLRLVVHSNIEGSQYALNTAVSSESVVLLGKKNANIKQVNYKGTLAVDDYALDQNFPNPFNPTTTISYALPQDGMVTLKIYDALGREVGTLVNEFKKSGRYTTSFNASWLSSGVYIYKLTSNLFTMVKKMTLVK